MGKPTEIIPRTADFRQPKRAMGVTKRPTRTISLFGHDTQEVGCYNSGQYPRSPTNTEDFRNEERSVRARRAGYGAHPRKLPGRGPGELHGRAGVRDLHRVRRGRL